MSEMTSKGKIWSYGVAYVSLAVGAGVSVAGNVADTHRIAEATGRGPDSLDIFIAGFWPAAVLLVIEMFVSRLWPKTFGAQAIRWTASVTFGFIAAYMSWIHLSDLLASRSQPEAVSTLGPLAIDGLAIMATALILAARGHGVGMSLPELAKSLDTFVGIEQPTAAKPTPIAPVQDIALDDLDRFREAMQAVPSPSSQEGLDTDDSVWQGLVARLGDQDEPTLPAPVSPAPMGSNRVRPDAVPVDAASLIYAWRDADLDSRPRPGDVDKLVAAAMDVHPRTARRWRDAILAA